MSLGYIRRDEERGSYRLSLRCFEIGSRIVSRLDILELARPHLERLSAHAHETVHLVLPDGADIVYIYKADCESNAIRLSSRVGLRSPMYCTGVGKCMLAALPPREVEAIWQASQVRALTPHTITQLEPLFKQLEEIRRCGYAMDNEENELGVRCIATPVFGMGGQAVSAISLSAPLARLDDARVAELAPAVVQTGRQISAELGYTGELYAQQKLSQ